MISSSFGGQARRTLLSAMISLLRAIGLVTAVHTIRANGEVAPSVICGVDGCGFHRFIALDGWETKAA